MSDNQNEFKEQLEGADKAAESESKSPDPQAGVSPTTQGSETPGEESVPGQPGSQEGDTNPESGNAEQQAEVEGENPGEQPSENPETPANPPAGSGEAPAEAGNVEPAQPVQPENGDEAVEPSGEDENQGQNAVQDGVATKEEQEEYARLITKRKNMPLDGDDIARWDYLSKLKMEG
jgi:hypothetical protein